MRRFAYIVVATLVATALSVSVASAGHDGSIPDPPAVLDACTPAWDPGDSRIVTWIGRTLHGEPDAVRDLFYRVWAMTISMPDGTCGAGVGNGSACTRNPRPMDSARGRPWS